MAAFSSAYIKRIGAEVNEQAFTLVLHNCAAKMLHLPAILETGLNAFHFGSPMDIAAALGKVPTDVVLCGNLDPAAVFVQMLPAEVVSRTSELLHATAAHRNFVISSGCDVPHNAPLANLDAFYQSVNASAAIS